MEDNNKYTNIENLIKENSHLKNKELAQKIGKSLGWLKAFKAFMNAEDKQKYKDSSNAIYKAIYNIWINDTEAQQKELERDKLKKKVKELKSELKSLKSTLLYCENSLQKCNKTKEELNKELNILKEKYSILTDTLEEHKEKITKELEKKLNQHIEKLNQESKEVFLAFKDKERELEKEKEKYTDYRLDYNDQINKFELKKKGILGIIIAEFFVIVYLFFTYVLHISA